MNAADLDDVAVLMAAASRWRRRAASDQYTTEGTAELLKIADSFEAAAHSAATLSASPTTDGSGSLPPDDPGPSPTPDFGVIVTIDHDLPAGTQLWVRRQFGELAVDSRFYAGSWGLGQYAGLTVEVAP